MATFYLILEIYMGLAVGSYFVLLLLSFCGDFGYGRKKHVSTRAARIAALGASAPNVTIVAPAKNEGAIIKASVASLLSNPYPNLSLIVVDDGSTDETAGALAMTYKMYPLGTWNRSLPHKPIISVWKSDIEPRLTLVKKFASEGSKGDATNAGLEVLNSNTNYVFVTDIDSVLEPDTLLKLVARQQETGADAVGCVLRPLNGCTVQADGTVKPGLPKGYWTFVQVCEYLRAFQLRHGWSSIGTLNNISGASGFFTVAALQNIGGFNTTTTAEDLDSTWRLYQNGLKTAHEPSTNVYTQVPDTRKALASQRKRWSRGLTQIAITHSSLLFKFSRHSFMLAWMMVFEMIEPFLELAGLCIIAYKAYTHTMTNVGWLWILAGILVTPVLSTLAIIQMERKYRRLTAGHIFKLLAFSATELIPAKLPFLLYWRLVGVFQYLLGNKTWEQLPRQSF